MMGRSTFAALEDLLAEIFANSAIEHKLFPQLVAPGTPLVIYGAGQLGRKVLAGLRQIGTEPYAFLDQNPALQNQKVDGISVHSPECGPHIFPEGTAVLLAIWSPGTNSRQQVIFESLRQSGFARTVSFIPLFWAYPEIFLPHFRLDLPSKAAAAAADIRRAYALLADTESCECFLEQLRWQLAPEVLALPQHTLDKRYNEHTLYRPRADEVFIDCGAYTGDTLELFLNQRGSTFTRFIALEPDPKNFATLQSFFATLPESTQARISCLPYASTDRRTSIRFNSGLEFSSRIDANAGNIEVAGVPLDEICAGLDVSYIKMDIEGAEPAAIEGARQILVRCAPIVAACVYHQQDHLWCLILQHHLINPDYRFFLRRYEDEYGDVVLYAVPPSRLHSMEAT